MINVFNNYNFSNPCSKKTHTMPPNDKNDLQPRPQGLLICSFRKKKKKPTGIAN
jgi:hypothetical protein